MHSQWVSSLQIPRLPLLQKDGPSSSLPINQDAMHISYSPAISVCSAVAFNVLRVTAINFIELKTFLIKKCLATPRGFRTLVPPPEIKPQAHDSESSNS